MYFKYLYFVTYTMTEKSTRKQTAISLKMKMELLKAVDEKRRSKTEICKEFGIANSTLSTIIKNRDQITSIFERSMFEPERKRMRTAKNEALETALLFWFNQARSQNAPLSGPLLLERANELAKQMGIEFSNSGWLDRFKKRNGIILKNVCSEGNQVLTTKTKNWLQSTLPSLLKEYDTKDVFNANETSLFYQCLPDKTLSLKGQFSSEEEKSKEIIMILVGCNSDGSEKLPLFVIGSEPLCFKNVGPLTIEYTANKKMWMKATIFTDWILNLDKQFIQENRKVAIITDSCLTNPNVILKAIKLIFLPLNGTSVLQPCDQGIIRNLKFHYRKQLLQKYLLSIEAKENFSVNLLDALHMLGCAWNSVMPKTIENCFRQAGFSKVADSLAPQELVDIETEPTFNEMFRKVSTIKDCPTVSLDEFVAVDDDYDVCSAPIKTDKESLKIVQSSKDPINVDSDIKLESNKINIAVPVPTTSEMQSIMKSMRSYLNAYSNGEMNKRMDDIEQFVNNLMLKKTLEK